MEENKEFINSHSSNNNVVSSAPTDQNQDQDRLKTDSKVNISDIVGEFGFYQLSLTMLIFIRYTCVAMMASTGPLIAPKENFTCLVPDTLPINKPVNESLSSYLHNKCQLDLLNGTTYNCKSWSFNTSEHGITLTDSFDLVCDSDWLRSAYQSIVSAGVVVAMLVWGPMSDKYGRYTTVKSCFIVSLISGTISYLTKSFVIYTLARSLCTLSDVGLAVSLTTILIELLGARTRGPICVIVYTGWSLGIMVMPWLTSYFLDYQQLMLFTVVCHIATLPWLITVNESVRWLVVNGKFDAAGHELRRVSKYNCKSHKLQIDEVNRKFEIMSTNKRAKLQSTQVLDTPVVESKLRKVFGGEWKFVQLLKSKDLAIITLTLIWTTFNSELIYSLLIMISSDVGNNVKLNYGMGFIMEVLATILSIVMISKVRRKVSLVSILLVMSLSCLIFAMVQKNETAVVWILNISKLTASSLTSFVYIITTEAYPTNLRQTGIGLVTLGSFGAATAPFIRTELVNLIGMTYVMLVLSASILSSAAIVPFFLNETQGQELSDDVDEI